MKKLNILAAVTTAAAMVLTNTTGAMAGSTGTYTYFGTLSGITAEQPENSSCPPQAAETTTKAYEPVTEETTEAHTWVHSFKPETKPSPETTTKHHFSEPTTREHITETTTSAQKPTETTTKQTVTETSTEATTEKQTETTTKQTTTEVVTETTTKQTTTEAPTETTTAAQASSSSTANQILQLVNEERAAAGLSALTLDSSLTYAAQLKAQDMADNGYFSHTSPTYGTPFQMLSSLGISYKSAGENIAKGQKSAEAVMTAWMNSEGHKANILSSSYGKLGVGYVYQNGTTYWVQIFTD